MRENGGLFASTEIPKYELVRSYYLNPRDRYFEIGLQRKSWIYDDALAVIAFCIAGEKERAGKILSHLQALQASDGSLDFSYDVYRGKVDAVVIRCGAMAWVGYAAVCYMKHFQNNTYLAFARSIADYLLTFQNVRTGSIKGGPDVSWYSTEHNIDAFFFLRDLGELAGQDKYKEAAQRVSLALYRHHLNPSTHVLNQGIDDPAGALDCSTWGGLFFAANGDQSHAAYSKKSLINYSVSGQTIPLSTAADTYNIFYSSDKVLTGYKPYRKDSAYPDAPAVVWSEGTMGVYRDETAGISLAGQPGAHCEIKGVFGQGF